LRGWGKVVRVLYPHYLRSGAAGKEPAPHRPGNCQLI